MTLALILAPFLFLLSPEPPDRQPEPAALPALELVGPVVYSDWSRSSFGDTRTELQANGLLQTMEFGERGDKPCYLRASFLNASGSGTTTRILDECRGNGHTMTSHRAIGSLSTTSAPHGIYSVKVCGGESPRLKGVQLQRKNLLFSSDGIASTGQEYRKLEMKRTNCRLISSSGWDRTTRRCPAASNGAPTFAVGLGVTLNNGSVVNLRLMCKEVRRPAQMLTRPAAPLRPRVRRN